MSRMNQSRVVGGQLWLNYGQLPTVKQFNDAYRAAVGAKTDLYEYELKGQDAMIARAFDFSPYGPVDAKGLYVIIARLVRGLEEGSLEGEARETVGNLASSFLYSIGIEWI